VRTAVSNVVGPLTAAVRGLDATNQTTVDRALIDADGTPEKSRLGANAILGVSMAVARAAAAARGVPLYRHLAVGPIASLPIPMTNVINGGAPAANGSIFRNSCWCRRVRRRWRRPSACWPRRFMHCVGL
jgi:enolase